MKDAEPTLVDDPDNHLLSVALEPEATVAAAEVGNMNLRAAMVTLWARDPA